MKGEEMQSLRKAAQQALEYIEQHAIISGIPIRDALRAALEPVTACHELSKEGDKLSLPFNHFPDAGKMVATIRPDVTVEPVATINEMETVEPVAWISYESLGRLKSGGNARGAVPVHTKQSHTAKIPLYTAPPKREPLTAPQIHELDWPDDVAFEDILEFTRAIERAHGILGEK